MGCIYSLVNTRITINADTLERIIGILNVPAAHQDRIRRDGVLIVKAPSAPAGGAPPPARARRSRSSTERGVSSTRSRTGRRQT
jgi:hypothetical protein